jgi:hypothetical protein
LILICSFSPLTGDGVQYYLQAELSIKQPLGFFGKCLSCRRQKSQWSRRIGEKREQLTFFTKRDLSAILAETAQGGFLQISRVSGNVPKPLAEIPPPI